MPYRVSIQTDGSFRAVHVAADPATTDIANTFQSDFWHPFQAELRHRLLNEATENARQAATSKEGR